MNPNTEPYVDKIHKNDYCYKKIRIILKIEGFEENKNFNTLSN